MLSNIKPKTGRFMLAEPFMNCPEFDRTVVLLCEHDEEKGTFGLVVNRKMEESLSSLVPDLDGFDVPLYYGGPVGENSLYYLHDYPELIEGSVKISEGIYMGGDFEQLKSHINTRKIDPRFIRFYVGYSGWEAGQLTEEMGTNSWIVVPSESKYVFSSGSKNLWREVLRDTNDDHFRIISHFPEYPSLN
ncbi:MAG: YqgE/AlgH family protein [Chitinophagales bacterium]